MKNILLAILLLALPLLAAGQTPVGRGRAVLGGQTYDVDAASTGADTLAFTGDEKGDIIPDIAGQSFRTLYFLLENAAAGEEFQFVFMTNAELPGGKFVLHKELGRGAGDVRWLFMLRNPERGIYYEGGGAEDMMHRIRKGRASVIPIDDGGADIRISVVFTDRTKLRFRYKGAFGELPAIVRPQRYDHDLEGIEVD